MEALGEAVAPRALMMQGLDKPFQVTIATVTDASLISRIFGAQHTWTKAMDIDVQCLVDAKAEKYESRRMEIEVGPAGSYDAFKSIGRRGFRVIREDEAEGVTLLKVFLEKNPRHYAYKDPDWQQAAARKASRHVWNGLMAKTDPSTLPFRVELSIFAVEPSYATQSVVKQRTTSAKGLTIHLMVKGVSFFMPMSPNTIAAEPLKLTGKFPNGLVDPTGMKPLYEDNIPVRYAIRAAKGCTIIGGMWYSPAALAKAPPEIQEKAPKWDTARRNHARAANRQQRRLARGDLEEGEIDPRPGEGKKKKAKTSGAATSSGAGSSRGTPPPAPSPPRGGGVEGLDLR